MDIKWHPEAQAEFDADIDWYDDREVGLGDRLEVEVLGSVDECADTPQAWAVWPGWDREPVVRSKRVIGFPYRVVYFVRDDLDAACVGSCQSLSTKYGAETLTTRCQARP